jgi:hypothetical protein
VLCKAPIVISDLQSAYCHQCFAKRLLSSLPVTYIKRVKHILSLAVVLAVIVNILPEEAGSTFP